MPTSPESGAPSLPFTFDEVADLRDGQLTADDEADLRRRMQRHPEHARSVMAAFDRVDAAFPKPARYHDPLGLPSDLEASLEAIFERWLQ